MDLDKPLSKWTLKDFSEFCKDRDCTDCELRKNVCDLPPDKWDLADKGSDITAAASDLPAAENTNVPDKPAKPRLAEVLGVDVGERFFTPWFPTQLYVSDDGDLIWDRNDNVCFDGKLLQYIINYPQSITRAPQLTDAELERCRVYGAKWVSMDKSSERSAVKLWDVKPKKVEKTKGYMFEPWVGDHALASVHMSLFPSIQPGDCICVEEASGE